ncbi:MAG: hypothetical protein R3B91_13195 [Planctomycetaceae bacterium]
MNLRQTAEVAALASMLSECIVSAQEPIATSALHAYWKSSQLRLKCWFASLRACPPPQATVTSPYHLRHQVCLCREILVAELLTRVWSTVLLARDAFHSQNECQQLARHVFNGQMEARREVLKLLADSSRLPAQQASVVDRLRRRVERWADMLVGPMVVRHGISDFVIDLDRAKEFAQSAFPSTFDGPNAAVHQLTFVGLSHAIPRTNHSDEARTTLNHAVARSVLAALPLHELACSGAPRCSAPKPLGVVLPTSWSKPTAEPKNE